MLCKAPFMNGVLPCPCGQCTPCRINRRRVWTHRILLESYITRPSCFLTLTYDDDHVPKDGSLNPRHVQLFVKRLRKDLPAGSLRYFFVGEYGDDSFRPHYHAALFGLGPEHEGLCNSAWKKGFVYSGDLTPRSAQYIAGYVVKKMTGFSDSRLAGKYPEFARMSLKPAIGAGAITTIFDAMCDRSTGEIYLDPAGDVTGELRVGGKSFPLGRYLKGKLREKACVSDDVKAAFKAEMFSLYDDQWGDSSLPSAAKIYSFKEGLLNENKGKVALIEARSNLYSKKGSL